MLLGSVLNALKPQKPDVYDLEIDPHLNVIGVRGLGPNFGECWPIKDLIYSRYMPLYGDPFGTSDFRAAYSAYWMRDTVTKLRAINAEKSTGGVLVGTYTDPTDRPEAERALQHAKSNTWMAVPEGVKIEALQLASKGEQDWKSFVDDCDKQILIAIVGAYLQVLESTVTDARGNASVSKNISELFQWLIAVQVQEIFNKQVFPLIGRFNYSGMRTPRLVLGGVNEDEITKIVANLTGLRGLGINNLSKKSIFARTGAQMALDKDDELGAAPMLGAGYAGGAGLDWSAIDADQTASPAAGEKAAAAPKANELLNTVGGATSLTGIQTAYYANSLPREAAIQAAIVVYQLTKEQAEDLFPPQTAATQQEAKALSEGKGGAATTTSPSARLVRQAIDFLSDSCRAGDFCDATARPGPPSVPDAHAVKRVSAFAEVEEARLPAMIGAVRMGLRRFAVKNSLPLPLVSDTAILAAMDASAH